MSFITFWFLCGLAGDVLGLTISTIGEGKLVKGELLFFPLFILAGFLGFIFVVYYSLFYIFDKINKNRAKWESPIIVLRKNKEK